ncbi:MAG: cytochrome c nitrite reductase small subunit [Candidatus Eremiobacterota bacterium]
MDKLLRKLTLIFLGMLMGTGFYTFYYAKGYSYMFDKPEACINCHVMREHYDGWRNSSHHAFTTCNDCHVPHEIVYKYPAKGLIGMKHSYYFTAGNFPEPIKIGPTSKKIVERNCRRCHEHMVGEIENLHIQKLDCTSCHNNAGHNK